MAGYLTFQRLEGFTSGLTGKWTITDFSSSFQLRLLWRVQNVAAIVRLTELFHRSIKNCQSKYVIILKKTYGGGYAEEA